MRHHDLIVIGAGSGNTIVDHRFAHLDVAIVEEGRFGGTCLNVGCIPTKMLVHPADLAREARHGAEVNVETRFERVRWPALRDRIFGRIDPIAHDGLVYRQGLSHVTVYDAHARFVGERTLLVGDGTGKQEISADRIVVAAGSRPVLPDLPGIDGPGVHTSDTIMRLDELPARLAIIGGGIVGAEFAHIFSAFGVEVTQVQRGPRLLSREDRDVSARYTEMAADQWAVKLSTDVTGLRCESGPEKTVTVVSLSDGTELTVDLVLMATGRRSNADLLAVEHGGIVTDDAGVIVVDDQQRTSAPGVWALGDVANHHQLKHVANYEAKVVQHNLLDPDRPIRNTRTAIPSAVFTSPQVASVGLTEQQAQESGTDYVSAVHHYRDVAYGWALADQDSFIKVLADPGSGRILGAHLVGPQASVLIQLLVQAMSLDQTAAEVAEGQYWIHPALTEVVENVLLKVAAQGS